MSWSGYIPGHLLREMIESEEAWLFADIDKVQLQQEIESIIRRETYVSVYGGCCCTESELEYVVDAAEQIIKHIETLLTPKVTP